VWYSSYEYYSIIEYSLAFGVAFGVFTGLFLDTLNQRISYFVAAVLSLISYFLIPHFDGSSRMKQEDWHFYSLSCLVFIAGQGSSLAILTTVKV